jgi:hypothetical protein
MKKLLIRSALSGALILFAGCGGSDSTVSENIVPRANSGFYAAEYPTEIELAYLNSCVLGGYNASACQCMFDYLTDQIPYERFLEIDDEMNNGAAKEEFPILGNAEQSCSELFD